MIFIYYNKAFCAGSCIYVGVWEYYENPATHLRKSAYIMCMRSYLLRDGMSLDETLYQFCLRRWRTGIITSKGLHYLLFLIYNCEGCSINISDSVDIFSCAPTLFVFNTALSDCQLEIRQKLCVLKMHENLSGGGGINFFHCWICHLNCNEALWGIKSYYYSIKSKT